MMIYIKIKCYDNNYNKHITQKQGGITNLLGFNSEMKLVKGLV